MATAFFILFFGELFYLVFANRPNTEMSMEFFQWMGFVLLWSGVVICLFCRWLVCLRAVSFFANFLALIREGHLCDDAALLLLRAIEAPSDIFGRSFLMRLTEWGNASGVFRRNQFEAALRSSRINLYGEMPGHITRIREAFDRFNHGRSSDFYFGTSKRDEMKNYVVSIEPRKDGKCA